MFCQVVWSVCVPLRSMVCMFCQVVWSVCVFHGLYVLLGCLVCVCSTTFDGLYVLPGCLVYVCVFAIGFWSFYSAMFSGLCVCVTRYVGLKVCVCFARFFGLCVPLFFCSMCLSIVFSIHGVLMCLVPKQCRMWFSDCVTPRRSLPRRFKELDALHREVSRLVRTHPTLVADIPAAVQVSSSV